MAWPLLMIVFLRMYAVYPYLIFQVMYLSETVWNVEDPENTFVYI